MTFVGAGQNISVVAQDCILLYRGFPIRGPLADPASVENPASSRLQDEVILPPPGSNVFYRLKTP
jgi:hypothetical protein